MIIQWNSGTTLSSSNKITIQFPLKIGLLFSFSSIGFKENGIITPSMTDIKLNEASLFFDGRYGYNLYAEYGYNTNYYTFLLGK